MSLIYKILFESSIFGDTSELGMLDSALGEFGIRDAIAIIIMTTTVHQYWNNKFENECFTEHEG